MDRGVVVRLVHLSRYRCERYDFPGLGGNTHAGVALQYEMMMLPYTGT